MNSFRKHQSLLIIATLAIVFGIPIGFVISPTVKLPAPEEKLLAEQLVQRILKSTLMIRDTQNDFTNIEFLDYECPACRGVIPYFLAELRKSPKLGYAVVNLPLPGHSLALPAAKAVATAEKLGMGIGAHKSLITGTSLSKKMIENLPQTLKVSSHEWNSNYQSIETSKEFEELFESCLNAGITYTPSFCILTPSGKLFLFPSYNQALKKASEWSSNPIARISH